MTSDGELCGDPHAVQSPTMYILSADLSRPN